MQLYKIKCLRIQIQIFLTCGKIISFLFKGHVCTGESICGGRINQYNSFELNDN